MEEDGIGAAALKRYEIGIDLIKNTVSAGTRTCMHFGQGTFTLIWAKLGQYSEMVRKGTVRLVTNTAATEIAKTVHPDD